jgi:hypothetical protein
MVSNADKKVKERKTCDLLKKMALMMIVNEKSSLSRMVFCLGRLAGVEKS